MGREKIWGQKSRIDSMATYFRALMEEFSLLDVMPDPLGPNHTNGRTSEEGI